MRTSMALATAGLLALSPARAQQPWQGGLPAIPDTALAGGLPLHINGNRVEMNISPAVNPLAWAMRTLSQGQVTLASHKLGVVLPDDELNTPSQLWLHAEATTTVGGTPLTLAAESLCGWNNACTTTTSLMATPASPSPLANAVGQVLGTGLPLKQERIGLSLTLADTATPHWHDAGSLRLNWQAEWGGDTAQGQPTLGLNASCGEHDCAGNLRVVIPLQGR